MQNHGLHKKGADFTGFCAKPPAGRREWRPPPPVTKDDIDLGPDEFRRMLRQLLGLKSITRRVNLQVLAFDKAEPPQRDIKRVKTEQAWRQRQDADAIGASLLLRTHRQRPGDRRAAEHGDEVAAQYHPITLLVPTTSRTCSETRMCAMISVVEAAQCSRNGELDG